MGEKCLHSEGWLLSTVPSPSCPTRCCILMSTAVVLPVLPTKCGSHVVFSLLLSLSLNLSLSLHFCLSLSVIVQLLMLCLSFSITKKTLKSLYCHCICIQQNLEHCSSWCHEGQHITTQQYNKLKKTKSTTKCCGIE